MPEKAPEKMNRHDMPSLTLAHKADNRSSPMRRLFGRGLDWLGRPLLVRCVALISGLCLTAGFLVLSYYNRPVHDDWALAMSVIHRNPVQATEWWYRTWSGRYSFIFLDCLLSKFLRFQTWLSPILCFASVSISAIWLLRLWLPKVESIAVATVAIIAACATTYTFGADWFWQAANLNYLPPIAGAMAVARYLYERASSRLVFHCFVAALVGFAMSGFNEMATANWCVLLGCAWREKARRKIARGSKAAEVAC